MTNPNVNVNASRKRFAAVRPPAQQPILPPTPAATPPKPNWRAFADGPPRSDGPVWVFDGKNVYLGRWDFERHGFVYARWDTHNYFTRELVSHWMPADVPQAPR